MYSFYETLPHHPPSYFHLYSSTLLFPHSHSLSPSLPLSTFYLDRVLPVDTTDCAGVIALTIVERLLAICPQVAQYRTEPAALDSSTDEGDPPLPVTGTIKYIFIKQSIHF